MPAEQIGDSGHGEQHDGECEVISLTGPTEQQRVHRFVDSEAASRHNEESQGGGPHRCPVATEGQTMMPRERHGKGHQPSDHIGNQRVPSPTTDQRNDDQPMHDRRGTSDDNEPSNPTPLRDMSWFSATREDRLAHVAVEHSRRRTICIAVDDFGLHVGINQAALRLAAMGHVQGIGCMVGGTTWPTWSRLLRRLEPQHVDLGLHLDLTESPSLPRTARPLRTLIRDSFLHRLDRRALRAEIRSQLDAFESAIGRIPDYVDGHQHVHQLPVVRDELLDELWHRYGWARPWLRSTRSPYALMGSRRSYGQPFAKPWIIEQLGARGLAAMARERGYVQNRCLLGVYDFRDGSQRYGQLLAAWLATAGDGDLLMCHPSLPNHDHDHDSIIDARNAEFQVLSRPEFGMQLQDAGIELRPMSRILTGRGVDD